jgi:hypothetical protein
MLMTKFVGKPYAGKLHVRFDEGVGKVYCLPALLYCLLCGLCGKKLTTKYAKKAQSNTEFLLPKIKFCSVHYDFTFDTAATPNPPLQMPVLKQLLKTFCL